MKAGFSGSDMPKQTIQVYLLSVSKLIIGCRFSKNKAFSHHCKAPQRVLLQKWHDAASIPLSSRIALKQQQPLFQKRGCCRAYNHHLVSNDRLDFTEDGVVFSLHLF